jgi:hypothetical protein
MRKRYLTLGVQEDEMPVDEASSEETLYGRYITSDGWFVLNLADALAVRNEEKGGATYGASAVEETDEPDKAYANWPGDFVPVRSPWPPGTDTKGVGRPRQ